MTNLGVERAHGLPLQQRRHPAGVLVAQPGDQDRVEPVQVATEVPEAGPSNVRRKKFVTYSRSSLHCTTITTKPDALPAEAAVDEHVEAVDAEQRGVALAPGEHVQRRVAEPDVPDHVRRRQRLLHGQRGEEGGDEVGEGGDGGRGGGGGGGVRRGVELDLAELRELLPEHPVLRPLALLAAVHVHRDGVLVGAHHPLGLVLAERAGELLVGVRAVLCGRGHAIDAHCRST